MVIHIPSKVYRCQLQSREYIKRDKCLSKMRAGKDRPKTGNNPEHQNETFLTYSTIYVAFKTNRVT